MMANTDARMRVVRFLHQGLRTCRGDDAEAFEHALNLTLSDTREASEARFLYRNVLRDARRSVRRSRKRHPTIELSSDVEPAFEDEIVDRLTTREVIAEMYSRSELTGAAFEAYLFDEPIGDTARRLGLTPRQIKYLRQRSFAIARELVH